MSGDRNPKLDHTVYLQLSRARALLARDVKSLPDNGEIKTAVKEL